MNVSKVVDDILNFPSDVDYWIVAVRFNEEKTHIDSVLVKLYPSGAIGDQCEEHMRDDVINNILSGNKVYFTAFVDKQERWEYGEKVKIVPFRGNKYLRTDPNRSEEDNLDKLPEY